MCVYHITGVAVDGTALPATAIVHDRKAQLLTLTPGSGMPARQALVIVIQWHGSVVDDTSPDVDDARGVFLSPNTVPPPDTPATAMPAGAGASARLVAADDWHLHARQRRRDSSARFHGRCVCVCVGVCVCGWVWVWVWARSLTLCAPCTPTYQPRWCILAPAASCRAHGRVAADDSNTV